VTWTSPAGRLRLLSLILRLAGVSTVVAFLTVFLPVEWMASTHEALGLGVFPRAPVVEYLARSIALLYGFHGVLMLIVAGDPVRFRPIVSYIATMDVIFGVAIAAIDWHAGMPLWWTMGESVTIMGVGIVIGILNRGGPA
jgi:hypothetical protein